MVLGGHRRELLLRGAEFTHVHAAHCGVDVHEQAVGAGRLASRRRCDAVAHGQQALFTGFGVMHVPGTVEGGEHAGLVVNAHLLGAHCEHDIGGATAHMLHGHVQRRAGAGAGVFHVNHRNALYAHSAQSQLPAYHVLAVHVALRGIGEIGGLQERGVAACVLQRGGDGLACEVFHAPLAMAAKRRHTDACDIDRFHGLLLNQKMDGRVTVPTVAGAGRARCHDACAYQATPSASTVHCTARSAMR